ncbi:GAF and ANTAR domain-containing protein [Amycolatopsis azurea]|uniref:GAF and ANTAR domain-containing protein n=1 Tax=Amycolatopsis azurea TaxID=36819 RepID=UPI00380A79DF
MAPSADLVTEIDRVQYRTRQGPCVDAIAEHEIYRTGDLAGEARWPDFAPAAVRAGVRTMLPYRLFVTETTLGALNIYSSKISAFSAQTELDGRMFATHAAIALVDAQHEADLHAAIEHRDTIGMAKGILMQRHDLDPVQAFNMLVQASQYSNLKLHAVAAWLSTTAATPDPRRQCFLQHASQRRRTGSQDRTAGALSRQRPGRPAQGVSVSRYRRTCAPGVSTPTTRPRPKSSGNVCCRQHLAIRELTTGHTDEYEGDRKRDIGTKQVEYWPVTDRGSHAGLSDW